MAKKVYDQVYVDLPSFGSVVEQYLTEYIKHYKLMDFYGTLYKTMMEQAQIAIIVTVLRHMNGNVAKSAPILGINERSLGSMIRRLQIPSQRRKGM